MACLVVITRIAETILELATNLTYLVVVDRFAEADDLAIRHGYGLLFEVSDAKASIFRAYSRKGGK